MTKPSTNRPRRRSGPRKLRPKASQECRLRAHHGQRADGRDANFTVWYEHLGEYFDDVLVSLKYDKRAVTAISALPSWARHWDAASNVWRIHPGCADELAAVLGRLGYTVVGSGDRG
jgi:hypothetical protein